MEYDELSCEKCSGNGVDNKMFKAFGVRLCSQCKGVLPLVTQTEGVKKYLLSTSDLSLLPHIKVPNPKGVLWQPMKLFRADQVQGLSREKYPDLAEEKQRRKELSTQRRVSKIQKKLKLLRKTVNINITQEIEHTHVFDSSGKCVCGMKVECEEF
ncbi:DNA-repair protein complementing XP-A cells [Nematocida displodere]|uniref:DNA-repair protein complementing XP-A cells n=1 Tax=Nematocida displodere TaxID=1805483 RepID=A0A177EBF2_9MICR|nr:DNA-repair protein complementing XP-A cells [Nematocida displodere]